MIKHTQSMNGGKTTARQFIAAVFNQS